MYKIKVIFWVLVMVVPLSLFSQIDSIKGNGLISVAIDSLPTIKFYESKGANIPIKSIEIFDDEAIKAHNIREISGKEKNWFKPFSLHLDYYIFYIQVYKIEEEWMEVIVNEESNQKLWLKNSPNLKYFSWEEFILNTVSITPINSADNPLLVTPEINSRQIKKPVLNCLTPVSIDKEWLKVKVDPTVCDRYNEMGKNDIVNGYLRWKKGEKLLIHYFLVL